MSDSYLYIFPKDPKNRFSDINKLEKTLLKFGIINKNVSNNQQYTLTKKYKNLLFKIEKDEPNNKTITFWFEYSDEIKIQVCGNSQYIENVFLPNSNVIVGNLEIAYDLIGRLHKNIDAEYKNEP